MFEVLNIVMTTINKGIIILNHLPLFEFILHLLVVGGPQDLGHYIRLIAIVAEGLSLSSIL